MEKTEGKGAFGISLRGVSKSFEEVEAVRDVSLDVREGEFMTLLGPSGCGKTTTLRIIAGFETLDEGRVLLRGEEVSSVQPNNRNVNMVFQNYALFPHMSVRENVAFGLKVKKISKQERHVLIEEMLSIVRLEGMERRRPPQLSGGQQQRVALARALVNRPAALLLDEPLGALDLKLRKQMQLELKRIQHELGTTFVYVTHDQEEALSMSDRIAVMNDGRVEQIGTPREVYERPATTFVADFVGLLNAVEIEVEEIRDGVAVGAGEEGDRVLAAVGGTVRSGERVTVAVRPERVAMEPEETPPDVERPRLGGVVERVVYLGTMTQFHVTISSGRQFVVNQLSTEDPAVNEGARVVLTWQPDDALVMGSSDRAGPDG